MQITRYLCDTTIYRIDLTTIFIQEHLFSMASLSRVMSKRSTEQFTLAHELNGSIALSGIHEGTRAELEYSSNFLN